MMLSLFRRSTVLPILMSTNLRLGPAATAKVSADVGSCKILCKCFITYVQGQSPRKGVREYFYYIDHQGQLFLDDTKVKNFITCFKEKQFLAFFFKRLKLNKTGIFEKDFPYVSPCGKEFNYIRCEDRPIVFSSFVGTGDVNCKDTSQFLTFNGIGPKLTFEFQPNKLCMLPRSGRIYHPAPEKAGSD